MKVHQATRDKFLVVGYDTFEGPNADYFIGEYATRSEAEDEALKRGGEMNPVYVFDDRGNQLFKCGSY